ncbi:hypothetical protein LELG_02345 [Lodderomyces elongisporus NRRL YB-4239]|uniref:tRNA (guanine(9)-N1)-methyltransferase n=1 Tax=Lodderomyces elongisporus (strain ATCC 11503 / CBS 2605 / JCM 1781 / NBRC 1676 / NRRL YB-4239) TaxID=379508 RepID=A5DYA8_LODEL|nr:hypothetical protein LELG_02345 [Lodderomyces elongisporus NRRL YB-4239]
MEPQPPQHPKKVKNIPSPEEIERRRQERQNEVIPEGMSRREWKKQRKEQEHEATKEEYKAAEREKRRQQRARRAERMRNDPEYRKLILDRINQEQKDSEVKIVIDCEFDDLMLKKEIISLSNQIKLSYAIMKQSEYNLPIQIASFDKQLKERFDTSLADYKKWQGINFTEKKLSELVTLENKDKFVYLTADTEEEVEELKPDHTYIIGGIVDRNRYKNLCADKAKKMGIRVARLPIGKYIKINSRAVLVTSHVYEICCRWFESRNWGIAFNKVLPPRKIANKYPAPAATEEGS